MAKKNKGGLVYSTNPDYDYNEPEEEVNTPEPKNQTLYVRKEVRNGKVSTVIKEFTGSDNELKELGKKLKNKFGVGGTAKDGDIIIQGDLHSKTKDFLQSMGYKTKG
jgi:translation initiation factor 1